MGESVDFNIGYVKVDFSKKYMMQNQCTYFCKWWKVLKNKTQI